MVMTSVLLTLALAPEPAPRPVVHARKDNEVFIESGGILLAHGLVLPAPLIFAGGVIALGRTNETTGWWLVVSGLAAISLVPIGASLLGVGLARERRRVAALARLPTVYLAPGTGGLAWSLRF